jgi:hypothetical protein
MTMTSAGLDGISLSLIFRDVEALDVKVRMRDGNAGYARGRVDVPK